MPIIDRLHNVIDDSFDEPQIKTYTKRWFVLFLFSCLAFANGVLFTSVVSITDIVCRYYKVREDQVNWAGNLFPFIYFFAAFPTTYIAGKLGLKALVIIGTSMNAVCGCLHFAGVFRNGYKLIMTGQAVAAMTVPIIFQVPVQLATVWFPEHQHAKATSLAIVANFLGLGVGFLQPTYMVPDSYDMDEIYNGLYHVYLSQVVFLLVTLILIYLFFDEKPPLPPSYAALDATNTTALHEDEDKEPATPTMLESIKILAINKNFLVLAQAYGFYVGLYLFFVTCLNDMVKDIVKERDIGWMGTSSVIASIIGVLVSSFLIDKYQAYRSCSLVLSMGTLVSWILFTLSLTHWKLPMALFITFAAVSLFGGPFFVVGIEYAAEITYPISDGVSSAIILLLGNLYGFLMVLFLGAWIEKGRLVVTTYLVIALYGLVFVLICFVRPNLNRHYAESHHTKDINVAGDSNDEPLLA